MRATRRLLVLATVVLPSALALVAHGCGSGEPEVENLCGWLGDEQSCYRAFAKDAAGALCMQNAVAGRNKGSFLGRDKLDLCVLALDEANAGGGQVVFDPAPTLDAFPLTSLGFQIVNVDASPCASGVASPGGGFSLTFEAAGTDGGVAPGGTAVQGGTFSAVTTEGRETLDTLCPNGEAHHFNKLQLSQCPGVAPLLPRAILESNPGTTTVEGFVRLKVVLPNTTGTGAQEITLFDCSIPKQPVPCANGVRDGLETDVDCGGEGTGCERCEAGERCASDTDCIEGTTCGSVTGIRQCVAVESGSSTTGATTTATGTGGAGGVGGAGGTGGAGGAMGVGGAGGA